jgi:Arc/MetJ-type ribon-helix-helix transcriptional regulator
LAYKSWSSVVRDQIQAIEREIEHHERSISRLKAELTAVLGAQREVEVSGLAQREDGTRSGKKQTIKDAIVFALRRSPAGLDRVQLLKAVNASRTASKTGIAVIKIDSLNTQLNKLEHEGKVSTDDSRTLWRSAGAAT